MEEEQDDVFVISGSLARHVLKGRYPTQMVNEIDRKIIQKIASNLSISFVPEKEREGEVCFMNSEEVRPEFKVSFAPVDLYNYIFALLQSPDRKEHLPSSLENGERHISYPKDATEFWRRVTIGAQLRAAQ